MIAETWVLPKMFFLIAFFLGIMYKIMVFGDSHQFVPNVFANQSGESGHGLMLPDGRPIPIPGITDIYGNILNSTKTQDRVRLSSPPVRKQVITTPTNYIRSPLWGMMTLRGAGRRDSHIRPQPQDNPNGRDSQTLNEPERFETVTAEGPEAMTIDATESEEKKWSPFFQLLGTKFIQTILTHDGKAPPGEQEVVNHPDGKDIDTDSDLTMRGTTQPEILMSRPDMYRSVQPGDGNTTVGRDDMINDSSRGTVLQSLVASQFSWVDVIIAIGCTAAVLLLLVNLAVCIRYVRRRGNKRVQLYDRPPPPQHTYRLRMDNLRLAETPSPACYSVASSSHKAKKGNRPRGCRKLAASSSRSVNSPSLGSAKTNMSMVSVVSDAATQYESMDAMLASFISSDLLVELNDRDSTCTSVSDGFIFSREYLNGNGEQNDGLTEF